MTTTLDNSRVILSWNGVLTSQPFAVEFYDAVEFSDLVVRHYAAAGGDSPLTINSSFSITAPVAGLTPNSPFQGGTFNVLSFTPADGDKIVIRRATSDLQEDQFRSNRPLPAEVVERALDKLYMRVQELEDRVSRSFIVDETTPVGQAPAFTIPPPEAGKYLIGNEAEDGYELAGLVASGTLPDPVPVNRGGTGATIPGDARSNLGLGTVATRNTGTGNNQVPLLAGTPGKLTVGMIPTGIVDGTIPLIGANNLLPASIIPTAGSFLVPLGRVAAPVGASVWDVPFAPYGTRVINGAVRVVFVDAFPATTDRLRMRIGRAGSTVTTNYYSSGVCIRTADATDTLKTTTVQAAGSYVSLQREADTHREGSDPQTGPSIVVIDVFPNDGSSGRPACGTFYCQYPVTGTFGMNTCYGSWFARNSGAADRVRLQTGGAIFEAGSPFLTTAVAYVYAMVMP